MHPFRFATVTAVFFAGLCGWARSEDSVAVVSSASPEYVAHREGPDGKLIPQSYVVMKGKYVDGPTRDGSVENMPFERMLEILQPGLAKQSYFPAKDLGHADLLLVVHWGTAAPPPKHDELDVYRDIRRQDLVRSALGEGPTTKGEAMESLRFMALEDIHELSHVESGRESMARTLGLEGLLRAGAQHFSELHSTLGLQALLEEERYFINVSAYDARSLVSTKELKRVWIARLSVRSPGMNFRLASERMSVVGGNFFGTDRKGLTITPVRVREGRVEIKPIEVVK